MVRQIQRTDIPACAQLVRDSFLTVADTFHITPQNAPAFTAFSTTAEKLYRLLDVEQRPMFAYYDGDTIVGYYNLELLGDGLCELNNLCVHPGCRHRGIGEALLQSAFTQAKALGCRKMKIGIVEENQVLRRWYEGFGFVHTGTEKFDFFPFTCGYLEITL